MFQARPQKKKYHWPDFITQGGKRYPCIYQDRIELEKEAEDSSKLRNILYNRYFSKERFFEDGHVREDFVLPVLFWRTVVHDGMAVLHLMGPSNGGKSYLAHALAHELLSYWLNYRGIVGKVWYFFSYSVALNYMDQFKKGDVVIIDEHSHILGQDSASAAARFSNTLRATRKRGVSYFICDPEEQNVPNCSFMLRTAFIVVELMITRCLTYTGKTHRLDGLSDWKVPLDEIWFKEMVDEYELEKDAYLAGFARRGGAADKGLADKQIRMARRLMKMVKENGLPKGKRGWVKRLKRYLTDLDYDSETYATRDQVIDRVMELLEKGKDFDDVNIGTDFGFDDSEQNLVYAGQTDEIREAILARMVELGAQQKDTDVFVAIADGMTIAAAGTALDIPRSTTGRIWSKFPTKYGAGKVEGFGRAWEDVYSAILMQEGVPHIKRGGVGSEPDVLILDDDEQVIAVHSAKCSTLRNGSFKYHGKDIADSEYEEGVPIHLVLCDLQTGYVEKVLVTDEIILNGYTFKRPERSDTE